MKELEATAVDPEKLAAIFDHAAELAPEEIARYLDEVCRDDFRLRAEVESLLHFDREPSRRGPPAAVGRFAVTGKLGEGGMGVVYRARDPALDREVAVKLVHPARAAGGARPRLLREAQAMARVTHPNVVTVYEVGVHGDGVFIAMELVPGETLASWLGREPRATRSVLAKFVEAGRGLGAAHRAGVLHRDFKPENVILGEDGRARVLDFGLARSLPEEDIAAPPGALEAASPLSGTLTEPGGVVGTPVYMSPEHFSGAVVAASDQWSFCVALYRALFGEHPFQARGVLELYTAIANEEPKAPDSGDVPPAVVAAILRGLARAPDDRWESVDVLVDALEAELGIDPSEAPSAFRRQRRRGAIALTTLGLVNLIVLGFRTDFRFDVGLRAVALQSGLGILLVAGVAFVLRRALRASAYNRRVMVFFAIALMVPTVHRLLAVASGEHDTALILRSDAVFTIGLALVGALAIERWLQWPAAVMGLYLVLSYAVPLTVIPGYGLALIMSVAIGVWSWRDDPRGLRALGESSSRRATKSKGAPRSGRAQPRP